MTSPNPPTKPDAFEERIAERIHTLSTALPAHGYATDKPLAFYVKRSDAETLAYVVAKEARAWTLRDDETVTNLRLEIERLNTEIERLKSCK